jgi:hypothetical protein
VATNCLIEKRMNGLVEDELKVKEQTEKKENKDFLEDGITSHDLVVRVTGMNFNMAMTSSSSSNNFENISRASTAVI